MTRKKKDNWPMDTPSPKAPAVRAHRPVSPDRKRALRELAERPVSSWTGKDVEAFHRSWTFAELFEVTTAQSTDHLPAKEAADIHSSWAYTWAETGELDKAIQHYETSLSLHESRAVREQLEAVRERKRDETKRQRAAERKKKRPRHQLAHPGSGRGAWAASQVKGSNK